MNKTTIASLLLGVAAAAGILYALGVFESSSSSVSIEMSAPKGTTASVASEVQQEAPKELATTKETTVPPVANNTPLTKTEVAKHATKDDCWVIVSNNVYNFTEYIVMHPGGQGAIARECGKDGTQTFLGERKHLQPNVAAELATYLLGALK